MPASPPSNEPTIMFVLHGNPLQVSDAPLGGFIGSLPIDLTREHPIGMGAAWSNSVFKCRQITGGVRYNLIGGWVVVEQYPFKYMGIKP